MIEQIFESLLDGSKKFLELVTAVEKMLKSVTQLAETLFKLSKTVEAHQDAILALSNGYATIMEVFKSLEEYSAGVSLLDDTELN